MILDVEFSDVAVDMLKSISEFIDHEFGKSTTDKFLNNAYKTFDTISKQPNIFKSSNFNKNVRIGLINKNCSFYYEIQESKIFILFLWDNRQDPSS